MKWYWYIIIYLLIEFILYMTINYIAKKKGCYEIMKTISDKEVEKEYKVLYYGLSLSLLFIVILLRTPYVLLIILFAFVLVLAPFCNKLALFLKAMDMKERNVKVDYSVSGKEKNRIDAREDLKEKLFTIGMYSVISDMTKKRKK